MQSVNAAGRLAQLLVLRGATWAIERLRHKTQRLEIYLDGLNRGLRFKEVADCIYPRIDLAQTSNPVAAIMGAPEFSQTIQFFADNPVAQRSLVSPDAQALLYALVRNLRPQNVFEIGTFKGGTSEAICRALNANGAGTLHTVDPVRTDYIKAIFERWPQSLLKHLSFYPTTSMDFYKTMERAHIHPGLVFVDGNHDYEFAAFDIGFGARQMQRGGFIVVDNIAQPGPFYAAIDFIAAHPEWREFGLSPQTYDKSKAYDRYRTTIVNTDFMVLGSPQAHAVGSRAWNSGLIRTRQSCVKGLRLKLARPCGVGVLSAQVVLRGFGATLQETLGEARVELSKAEDEISIVFTQEVGLEGAFAYYTIEPWLIWNGAEPLQVLDAQPF
jgi:predicted O-methyltransferase YrrM